MDKAILIILGLFKDTEGQFIKLVALRHNGELGNGNPEDEYTAHGVDHHPSAGFIKTASKLNFSNTVGKRIPAIGDVVTNAFLIAPVVRDPDKIKKLLRIKRLTPKQILEAFELTTEDIEESEPYPEF